MCGICGFISKRELSKDLLLSMNDTLKHRGPDDHGEEIYSISSGWIVGFAQRRLSIIDLSVNGHQPMHSLDKRISVIFNGEIYNFKELKKEITEYSFRTECDTEIIIASYLKWGISFVEKLNGMFAIALLDRKDNSIYFIRDRIGKKPLYYYHSLNGDIIFASEMKALMKYPFFEKKINTKIIGKYLYRQYISAPDTIFEHTYKLESGSILKINDGNIVRQKYWDIAQKYSSLKTEQVTNYEYAKSELKKLLSRAVEQRLISDVPIGAFLSGGYDSTIVCALAQTILDKPMKTFSLGFYSDHVDEAQYAKKIAEHLKTEHYTLYPNEEEVIKIVNDIPVYFDEPFADSSEISTMIISEFAKKQVSVVLSGDGGDELFGGYNIYSQLQKAQNYILRGKLLHVIRRIPYIREMDIWNRMKLYQRIASDDVRKENKTQTGISQYLNTINNILLENNDNYYYEFESRYGEKRYDITRMLLDQETYLQEDILAKVDRASMKYALECRCPILDKEVIEYSYKLLPEYKNDNGNQKKILKDIAYEMVPRELLERSKSGFGFPIQSWLRGTFKDQLLDWTSGDFLKNQGIFDPDITMNFIRNYLEHGDLGKGSGNNYSQIVWPYFIFQQWYVTYML